MPVEPSLSHHSRCAISLCQWRRVPRLLWPEILTSPHDGKLPRRHTYGGLIVRHCRGYCRHTVRDFASRVWEASGLASLPVCVSSAASIPAQRPSLCALGVGLALRGVGWNRSILTAFALSVAVETAQLLFVPGRDATLGDVVTNTLGAALGLALARRAHSWLHPPPRFAAILGLAWCVLWLAIQAASSFSFTPSIPDSTDFGQLARELGDFDVFPGRVLAATIGNVAVLDAQLAARDSIASRLRSGATVSATVLPGGLTTGMAPIVRVADAEQDELVLLGQDKRSLFSAFGQGRDLSPSPTMLPCRSISDIYRALDTLGSAGIPAARGDYCCAKRGRKSSALLSPQRRTCVDPCAPGHG